MRLDLGQRVGFVVISGQRFNPAITACAGQLFLKNHGIGQHQGGDLAGRDAPGIPLIGQFAALGRHPQQPRELVAGGGLPFPQSGNHFDTFRQALRGTGHQIIIKQRLMYPAQTGQQTGGRGLCPFGLAGL